MKEHKLFHYYVLLAVALRLRTCLAFLRRSSSVYPHGSLVCRHAARREVFFSVTITLGIVPAVAQALTPKEASRQYDSYAPGYDKLDGGQASSMLGIEEARAKLIGMASGNVLEIGVGTGLNLDKYVASQITSLTLVDVSEGMLVQARNRIESLSNLKGIPVTTVQADATADLVKRFGQGKFDTVLDSFSLCVMENPAACLDQMKAVSKDQVLLLENARSSNSLLGAYQDVTANAAAQAGGKGCVYNQNVRAMIEKSGLRVVEEEAYAAGLFRAFVCHV